MRKNIIKIFALISILAITPSCNDILDTSPNDQIGSSLMWTSEDLVQQGMDGIYQALRLPVRSKTGSGSDASVLVGTSTSLGYYAWEAFGMTGQAGSAVGNVFSGSVNATNPNFSYTWKWCFTGINRATDAILNVGSSPISEVKKDTYLAEAKILRAFFYMRLNELFGRGIGLPIYDYVPEPTTATKGQSSEAEVWDFIIKDLTEAINSTNLPNNTIGKSGRVSKGAAYALRGKAYLLRSMSLGENYYAQAASDFEQVGNMGYALYNGNYADLFKVANENSAEMIMSVQNIDSQTGNITTTTDPLYGSPIYGSSLQKYMAPWNGGAADRGSCWTSFQVTPAVVDLYEVVVDNSTTKPFNWEEYIPGYTNMSYNDRRIFFLRDTKKDGAEILPAITKSVQGILDADGDITTKNQYLEEGNEARIRAAYENRDPRLEASVITPYSEFLGINNSTPTGASTYTSRWPAIGKYFTNQSGSESTLVPGMNTTLVANSEQYFYYLFRKFVGEGTTYKYRDTNPIDEPIIRYADVLLMWAEALVEQNKLADAKSKVKQVRDRVGIPTMDKYFADQTTARNYVRDERRREFIGEGVNFFDEMRWKTLRETKFQYGPKTSMQVWGGIATGAPAYSWTEAWYTWPVPRAEVEINPNLQKTPGWTY